MRATNRKTPKPSRPASHMPGKRMPPDGQRGRVKEQSEEKKAAGIAGAPSPVGENDLA